MNLSVQTTNISFDIQYEETINLNIQSIEDSIFSLNASDAIIIAEKPGDMDLWLQYQISKL